jgi:uncharacterized protein (TIGR03067 family)
MIRMTLVLLFVSALPLACSRGGKSDAPASAAQAGGDLALLQGRWETVRMATAGKDLPPEGINKDVTVTFEGNQMITMRDEKVLATWTFTLDPAANPKRMTINTAKPGEKERLSFEIYKIEGDTLTTASGARDFPKSFTDATEKGPYLTVKRRVAAVAMEDKLRIEVVSLTPRTGDRVLVKFKVTNATGRDIVRAKATIVVLDAKGNELGSESHYVVKSGQGNLAPGATVEDDLLIAVSDPQKAASARFKIESVRGG